MGREIEIPRLDASNLGGVTDLMNKQNIKQDIDLGKAEADIMGRKYKHHHDEYIDPIKLYDSEMSQLANEIGIDLNEGSRSKSKTNYDINSYDPGHKSKHHFSKASDIASVRSLRSASKSDWSSSRSGDESQYSYDSEYDSEYSGSTISSGYGSGKGSDRSYSSRSSHRRHKRRSSEQKRFGSEVSYGSNRSGKYRSGDITQEKERRSHINTVINDIRSETKTTFGIESERIKDLKIIKLEQIDSLKTQLEEEDVNIESVGKPTINSSLEEIEATLRILTLKADRSRYSSIADEVILAAAEAVEVVFDGKRRIPIVNIAPNYQGYANTVAIKLARCRSSTASIVGDIIEKHSISPGWRLAMELLPSFLLYPRYNSKAQNKSSLHNEFKARAYGDIHNADRGREDLFKDLEGV